MSIIEPKFRVEDLARLDESLSLGERVTAYCRRTNGMLVIGTSGGRVLGVMANSGAPVFQKRVLEDDEAVTSLCFAERLSQCGVLVGGFQGSIRYFNLSSGSLCSESICRACRRWRHRSKKTSKKKRSKEQQQRYDDGHDDDDDDDDDNSFSFTGRRRVSSIDVDSRLFYGAAGAARSEALDANAPSAVLKSASSRVGIFFGTASGMLCARLKNFLQKTVTRVLWQSESVAEPVRNVHVLAEQRLVVFSHARVVYVCACPTADDTCAPILARFSSSSPSMPSMPPLSAPIGVLLTDSVFLVNFGDALVELNRHFGRQPFFAARRRFAIGGIVSVALLDRTLFAVRRRSVNDDDGDGDDDDAEIEVLAFTWPTMKLLGSVALPPNVKELLRRRRGAVPTQKRLALLEMCNASTMLGSVAFRSDERTLHAQWADDGVGALFDSTAPLRSAAKSSSSSSLSSSNGKSLLLVFAGIVLLARPLTDAESVVFLLRHRMFSRAMLLCTRHKGARQRELFEVANMRACSLWAEQRFEGAIAVWVENVLPHAPASYWRAFCTRLLRANMLHLAERFLPFNRPSLLPRSFYDSILRRYIDTGDYATLSRHVSQWPIVYNIDVLIDAIVGAIERHHLLSMAGIDVASGSASDRRRAQAIAARWRLTSPLLTRADDQPAAATAASSSSPPALDDADDEQLQAPTPLKSMFASTPPNSVLASTRLRISPTPPLSTPPLVVAAKSPSRRARALSALVVGSPSVLETPLHVIDADAIDETPLAAAAPRGSRHASAAERHVEPQQRLPFDRWLTLMCGSALTEHIATLYRVLFQLFEFKSQPLDALRCLLTLREQCTHVLPLDYCSAHSLWHYFGECDGDESGNSDEGGDLFLDRRMFLTALIESDERHVMQLLARWERRAISKSRVLRLVAHRPRLLLSYLDALSERHSRRRRPPAPAPLGSGAATTATSRHRIATLASSPSSTSHLMMATSPSRSLQSLSLRN
jgi:hypothetical protein